MPRRLPTAPHRGVTGLSSIAQILHKTFEDVDDELVSRALGALSQVHRLKAFRALVVAGKAGLTPGVLSEPLGISPASMSFHLKELLYAGFVSQTRDGRNLIYRASFDRMSELLGYLTSNCCEGQLCELEAPSCNC